MKLSDDLADIVGKKEASRAECVKQLWAYIKEKDLQDPKNKQYFKPDKKLAKIFGTDSIRGFGMVKFLKTHLSEKWTNKTNPAPKGDQRKKNNFRHFFSTKLFGLLSARSRNIIYAFIEINTSF